MKLFIPFLLALPLGAVTTINSVSVTPRQAVVCYQTDQSGFGTWRVSRGLSFASEIGDILSNGSTDNPVSRPANTSSVVGATTFTCMVIGSPATAWTLAADQDYWFGVTVGRDPEVTGTFHTNTIANGYGLPEVYPFDKTKYQNIAYPPTFPTGEFVDPTSGVDWFCLTCPLNGISRMYGQTQGPQAFNSTPISSLSGCANVNGITGNGSSYAKKCTGGSIFVPILPTLPNWPGLGWQYPEKSIDDIVVNTYCGSSGGSVTLTLNLTQDSGQTFLGSYTLPAKCPGGDSLVGSFPQPNPTPMFAGWNMKALPFHNLVAGAIGNVNVSGNRVTLNSPSTTTYFPGGLPIGSKLQITGSDSFCAGAYCTLASYIDTGHITIAESGSCSNCPYATANFGVVVTRDQPGVAADISLGLTFGNEYLNPDPATNGSLSRFNRHTVSVSRAPCYGNTATNEFGKSVSCNGASFIKFGTSLTGQLWSDGLTFYGIFIPYNADGSTRAESRLLGIAQKSVLDTSFNANGDTTYFGTGVMGLKLGGPSNFDYNDANTYYAQFNLGTHAWEFQLVYDPTLTSSWDQVSSCEGYLPYLAGPNGFQPSNTNPRPDCFRWKNITPIATTGDIMAQISLGWETGKDYLGKTVGIPHTTALGNEFPLSALGVTTVSGAQTLGEDGVCISFGPDNRLGGTSVFNTSGKLIYIQDNFSQGQGRWGGIHGDCAFRTGHWVNMAANPLQVSNNNNLPLANAWTVPIDAVNRQGIAPAVWETGAGTCNNGVAKGTAVCPNEIYTCSTNGLMAPGQLYSYLAGSKNCIQYRFTGQPCNTTPATGYHFPSGKTETAEFPCSWKPAYSQLQNVQMGDVFYYANSPSSVDIQNETDVIMHTSTDPQGRMIVEALRYVAQNIVAHFYVRGCQDLTFNPRSSGWSMAMAPSGTFNAACNWGVASWWRDVSNPDNTIKYGQSYFSVAHSGLGVGPTGNLTSVFLGYTGVFDSTFDKAVLTGPVQQMTAQLSNFNGTVGVGKAAQEQYPSVTQFNAAPSLKSFALDNHAMNPGFGNPPEVASGGLSGTYTFAAVPGTRHSFKISDALTLAPSSYKSIPYWFWGNKWYRDVSSPNTGNTADLPDSSGCRAFLPNQCFQGSSVGDLYVSSVGIQADIFTCVSDQVSINWPCVGIPSPQLGQTVEFRTDAVDYLGLNGRTFGIAGLLGSVYSFANSTYTPDGTFILQNWKKDGQTLQLYAGKRPAWKQDTMNRTTFVPMPVQAQAPAGAQYVRARFGYSEFFDNGTNNKSPYHCTPYAVDCSSEIPTTQVIAGTADPFSYVGEPVKRQGAAPNSLVTVSVPLISGRVANVIVDFLNNAGKVISSQEFAPIAVP